MPFSQNEKLAIAEKLALQITSTTDDKFWYNELFGNLPLVNPKNILTDISLIPGASSLAQAQTNVINNPTLIEEIKIRLTVDLTSNYSAYISTVTYNDFTNLYDNFISPALIRYSGSPSYGYGVRLYDGDPDSGGTELYTSYLAGLGGEPSWSFSYSSGILFVSSDVASTFQGIYDTNGLYIKVFHYIGATGGGGGASTTLVVKENDNIPTGSNIDTISFNGDVGVGGERVMIIGNTAYINPPPPPVPLGGDLILNGTVLYTGRESQNNINYEGVAGDSHDYLTTDATFTLSCAEFNNASIDNLTIYINGTVVADLDLLANFNELNRNGSQNISDYDNQGTGDTPINGNIAFTGGDLQIDSVNWFNNMSIDTYQAGAFTINITPSALRQGYNTIHAEHNGNSTNIFKIFYDTDVGANPSINNFDLDVGTPVIKHISGISYYNTGTVIDIDLDVMRAFDNVYHQSNAPVVLSNFPNISNQYISYTDTCVTNVSTPPALLETMNITDYHITVVSGTEIDDLILTATPRDPYGSYTTVNTPSHGISIMSIPDLSNNTTERFVDENYRFPITSNFNIVPTSKTGNWDSTDSLLVLNDELQVYDENNTQPRCLAFPSFDYSINRMPVSLNYTSLASGNDYKYVRVFIGTIDNSNGILQVPGLSDTDISSGNVKIEIKVPSKTDWLLLNNDYNMGTFEDNVKYVNNTWVASNNYNSGDWVIPNTSNGYKYKCTTDNGNSGASEPVWGTVVGGTTIDNGLIWTCYLIDNGEGCKINPTSHSPNIDGSLEFTLGTYSSDASVDRCIFIRVTYASNIQSGLLISGFGISNW